MRIGVRRAMVVALLLAPACLLAQRSTHILVGGGGVVPAGRTDSLYKPGAVGMVALVAGPQTSILGLRFDYSWIRLRGRSAAGAARPDARLHGLSANLLATLPGVYVKPYALGGAGWYRVDEPADRTTHNEFGMSAGLGITFPLFGLSGFLETRYHKVSAPRGIPDRRFAPVVVGFIF